MKYVKNEMMCSGLDETIMFASFGLLKFDLKCMQARLDGQLQHHFSWTEPHQSVDGYIVRFRDQRWRYPFVGVQDLAPSIYARVGKQVRATHIVYQGLETEAGLAWQVRFVFR